jgi:hypothetical protein
MSSSRVLACVVLLCGVPSTVALAQDPEATAIMACSEAVNREVRGLYPEAKRVGIPNPRVQQVSNAETGVSGRGQYSSNHGSVGFSFQCTYNIRNGRTYGVSVRGGGHGSSGGDHSSKRSFKKELGAALGAAVANSIANSIEKSAGVSAGNNWWSPSPGIRCNSAQSMCYDERGFSPRWTYKIYR